MKIMAYLTWEVRDKHGQLISYEKKEANSLVRSFIDLLYSQMSRTTVTNGGVDTGGTTRNPSPGTLNFECDAAGGVVTNGIVVGTGTAAVAVTDSALGTLILHGSISTKLVYGAVAFTNPVTAGTVRSFTIQRTFTNNSGSQITVTEVGLYVQSTGPLYFMVDRTLSTKAIANGATGTATYTIQVSV